MEESKLKQKQKTASNQQEEKIEIGILATAKKMGLSFEELNLFNLNDYLDFVDKWVSDEGGKKETVRQATQADIERFMG